MNRIYVIYKLLVFIVSLICSVQSFASEPAVSYSSIPGVDCVINPYRVADLASPVAGVIDSLKVERSQSVLEGQVVAQLKADVEQSTVRLAKYRASIQSEIRLGQVNVNFDSIRKQRIVSLQSQQAVSVENSDEAEREAGLSKWKLEQARELSEVRKLELQRAEEQLKQKTIRAPFNGVVLDTFKESGEYVENQPVLRLAQLDPLLVEAIVPMEYFKEVSSGMMAEIVPEILSGVNLKARVTVVDRIGDTASNTFGVRLVLANPGNHIPAGLKCLLKFIEPDERQNEGSTMEPDAAQAETANSTKISEAVDLADSNIINVQDNQAISDTQIVANKETSPEDENLYPSFQNSAQSVPGTGEQTNAGYFVVTPQKETRLLTRELMDRLRSLQIQDILKMDHGPYQGYIMLGFYTTLNPALQRQQQLDSFGVTTSILKRK